jgi:hypothetical protein
MANMETWAPLAWDDLKADEDEHLIASFSTFPFDSILLESCGSVVQDAMLHDEEVREVVQLAMLFCFGSCIRMLLAAVLTTTTPSLALSLI